MWLNLAPAMFLTWEIISIQLGFSHFYGDTFDRLHGTQRVMMIVSIALTMLWLLTRTVYMVFYAKSYATEYTLGVACKVVTMALLFCHAIMLFHQLLIERGKKHQQEMGWFICYFVAILFVANVVLTLFPAQKLEGAADLQQRGCCSSFNITLTLSVLACLMLLEVYHFSGASREQCIVFFR